MEKYFIIFVFFILSMASLMAGLKESDRHAKGDIMAAFGAIYLIGFGVVGVMLTVVFCLS